MSQNMVAKGDFRIQGGLTEDLKWKDSLSFNRVTWFFELTQIFDFMYSKYEPDSPFSNWHSSFEKRKIGECHQAFYVLLYDLDDHRYTMPEFESQLERQGISLLAIPTFYSSFKLHPSFEEFNLYQYDLKVACVEKKSLDKVNLNIPSFQEVVISI